MLASVDHIVLSTANLERCLDFYTRVIGMEVERYGAGRIALRFGPHKFNVHPPGFGRASRRAFRRRARSICAFWRTGRSIR